jgi:tetratricopeptide (TPR) repeat protein
MSAQILQKNENYILPYQILAYSHFVLNNRLVAKEYLLKLSDLDPSNKQRYLFMLGVSSYWMNQARDSIVYLGQVTDEASKSDVLRYQLLSYQRINDAVNQARSIQQLLARPELQQSDFATIFDLFFFVPYSQKTGFALYRSNQQLAIISLDQCYAKLPESQQTICTYGKAGILIAQGQLDKATQYLYYLTKQMPNSSVYLALGEYYAQQRDTTKARDFMLKAALLTRDVDDKQRIKEEILNLSQ